MFGCGQCQMPRSRSKKAAISSFVHRCTLEVLALMGRFGDDRHFRRARSVHGFDADAAAYVVQHGDHRPAVFVGGGVRASRWDSIA